MYDVRGEDGVRTKVRLSNVCNFVTLTRMQSGLLQGRSPTSRQAGNKQVYNS